MNKPPPGAPSFLRKRIVPKQNQELNNLVSEGKTSKKNVAEDHQQNQIYFYYMIQQIIRQGYHGEYGIPWDDSIVLNVKDNHVGASIVNEPGEGLGIYDLNSTEKKNNLRKLFSHANSMGANHHSSLSAHSRLLKSTTTQGYEEDFFEMEIDESKKPEEEIDDE